MAGEAAVRADEKGMVTMEGEYWKETILYLFMWSFVVFMWRLSHFR